MKLSKLLFASQPSPDGSCPVVISLYHKGMTRLIQTPVMCKPHCWSDSDGMINDFDPDSKYKNIVIDSIYRRAGGIIQDIIDDCLQNYLDNIILNIRDNIDFTFNNHQVKVTEEDRFVQIIDAKISSVRVLNTRRGYQTFRRLFYSLFKEGPSLSEIDNNFISDFLDKVSAHYAEESSMRHITISRFKSIISYGFETGMLKIIPVIRIPRGSANRSLRILSEDQLHHIYSIFTTKLTATRNILSDDILPLAIFILDIAFQGLAPIDLASLKISDISVTTLYAPARQIRHHHSDSTAENVNLQSRDDRENMKVAILITKRRKTGQSVTVVSLYSPIKQIIEGLSAGKEAEDYLLPCFSLYKTYSPEQRQNRLANFFHKMATLLNKTLSSCPESNILQFPDKITYYYARHAYCNLIDSLDIPRHIIQTLVGHKSTILEKSYLRPITLWEQACVSREMFKLLSQ